MKRVAVMSTLAAALSTMAGMGFRTIGRYHEMRGLTGDDKDMSDIHRQRIEAADAKRARKAQLKKQP